MKNTSILIRHVLIVSVACASLARGEEQNSQPDRRPAGIPRAMTPRPIPRPATHSGPVSDGAALDFPLESRSIDGQGNNLTHTEWGAAETVVVRLASNAYEDGVGTPAGTDRPSAREVSNAIFAQTTTTANRYGVTDYLWQWGQFLDHDIVETPTIDPAEAFDILVPTGDAYFDPFSTGTQTIPLNRSLYEEVDGVRQQVNAITGYIDASNVYGSDDTRAFALRTLDGTGKLKTSDGNLLPFNEEGLPNAPTADSFLFLAGDVRANEQIGLTAMHTLFVREHNYWAGEFAAADPSLSGEDLYQMARTMVAAEMQCITYREFLPLLIGRDGLTFYRGYKANLEPTISNEFGVAAYRVGHTMLSPQLLRVDADGNEAPEGHLDLASAFFNPSEIISYDIDSILRGLASQSCQEIDAQLIDDVRNFLFGPPGAGGFDLAALNIQRGRDHGIPGYNQLRKDIGLGSVSGFDEISSDAEVVARLESVYDTVDDVDAWVGLLAEDHVEGTMVGECVGAILADQFIRLRDGDRFFYKTYLPGPLVKLVEEQTLATIIRRNTEIGDELPDNVFLPGEPILGPAKPPVAAPAKKKKKKNRNKKKNRRNRRNT